MAFHNAECDFYEFVRHYEQHEDKKKFAIPVPQVYYSNKLSVNQLVSANLSDGNAGDGIIVMEDLSEGTQMGSLFNKNSSAQVRYLLNNIKVYHYRCIY